MQKYWFTLSPHLAYSFIILAWTEILPQNHSNIHIYRMSQQKWGVVGGWGILLWVSLTHINNLFQVSIMLFSLMAGFRAWAKERLALCLHIHWFLRNSTALKCGGDQWKQTEMCSPGSSSAERTPQRMGPSQKGWDTQDASLSGGPGHAGSSRS